MRHVQTTKNCQNLVINLRQSHRIYARNHHLRAIESQPWADAAPDSYCGVKDCVPTPDPKRPPIETPSFPLSPSFSGCCCCVTSNKRRSGILIRLRFAQLTSPSLPPPRRRSFASTETQVRERVRDSTCVRTDFFRSKMRRRRRRRRRRSFPRVTSQTQGFSTPFHEVDHFIGL